MSATRFGRFLSRSKMFDEKRNVNDGLSTARFKRFLVGRESFDAISKQWRERD